MKNRLSLFLITGTLFLTTTLLTTASAFAAETLKVTVGHMCCGACKTAATSGLKKLDWLAEGTAIDGTTITVTAKAGQAIDLIALTDALRTGGFPAKEINISSPVTLTVTHLCCASCTSALKANLAEIKSKVLDKDKIKIDANAKTVTLQPVAGSSLNMVAVLRQLEGAGVSATKAVVSVPAPAAQKSPH